MTENPIKLNSSSTSIKTVAFKKEFPLAYSMEIYNDPNLKYLNFSDSYSPNWMLFNPTTTTDDRFASYLNAEHLKNEFNLNSFKLSASITDQLSKKYQKDTFRIKLVYFPDLVMVIGALISILAFIVLVLFIIKFKYIK